MAEPNFRALLAARGTVWHALPPKVQAVSTVGAGASSIAGFIAVAMEGLPPEECLRRAVSFGTAACLTQGSQPPQPDTAEAIWQQIQIREV